MKITSGCRCCGEVEHLELLEGYDEDWTFTEAGDVKRTETGAFAIEPVDVVRCPICVSEAPLVTWNGPSGMFNDFWRIRRRATIAAWKQHDMAAKVVLDHLRAHTGETFSIIDPWPVPSVDPAETLAILEGLAGLRSSGEQPVGIEGIVNSLAGRIPNLVLA